MKRMRAEVDPFMEGVKDDVFGKMNLESLDQLEYVKMAYLESLRRDSPTPMGGTACMTKDVRIKGVDFRAGDAFWIMTHIIHQEPEQWREPERFVPDRFDPASEWYKKPDGGKRSPFAFVPFFGGVRVCLGKTFAEVTLRTTLPLWFHFFDFEMLSEEQKLEQPIVRMGAPRSTEIPMKLTTRHKVADLANIKLE